MKKFLSAFLAVLMVLSMVATSMVTVFAADGAEEVHSILVSNGEDIAADQTKDVKSHGWRNHNGHEFTVMELDGQKAAAITVKSNASSTTPRFHYYSDTTVDLTKFTYVEFDFYISDLAKMTDGFKPGIELSSAGLQDKAEVAGDVTGVEWKAGWNHVKVALADIKNATPGDAGAFDPTAWNFMRILVGGTGTFKASESDPLILAIDNFGFSDGTEAPAEKAEPLPTPVVTPTEKGLKEILVSNNAAEAFYDATKPGWGVGGGGQEYGNGWEEMTIDGKTGVLTALKGQGRIFDSRFHYYAAEPTDISGMTHLEMDIYIPNAAAFNGKQFIIELNDKGLWGHLATGEIRYLINNPTFVDGWNHLRLSLTDDFKTWGNTPALDKTIWQHIRVWFPEATTPTYDVAAGETLYYGVGNLKFTNDAYGEQSVSVPLVQSTKPADWNWAASLNIKKAGASAVSTTIAANKTCGGGAGGFLAQYAPKNGAVDASSATSFRFWLYTNDAAVMKTITVELELSSNVGGGDKNEMRWVGTLQEFVQGGIQNGWNEVVVPLNRLSSGSEHLSDPALKGTDWSKVCYFRMYNQQGFTTGAEEMTIVLDELAFLNDGGEVVTNFTGCDIKTDWEGPTGPMELDGEVVIGNTWEAGTTLGVGWFMFRYGLNFEGKYPAPADISGMKYIEFDFYVSDAMALINAGFDFELTSAGIQDKNESACSWTGPWKNGLDDGWNHMQMPLSWFAGDCDFTAWNFLRMFNTKDVVVGENGLTVAMKNVEFTTGNFYAVVEGETEKEEIVFTPAKGDKENAAASANKDMIVSITSGANDEKFYADATGEVVYKIPVSATKYVKYVTLEMTTGAQLLLQASTDGENWTTIYEYKYARLTQGKQDNGGLEKGYYTFDLTDAVVGEKGLNGDYVYIRIADSYPAKGWGGNLYYTPVTLNIIRTAVPHEVKMPEYGTTIQGWSWASSLNAPATSAGRFSASTTLAPNQTLDAAQVLVQYKPGVANGVDATGADAFEFDFYVSNAAAVKDISVELELCSGGNCDDHEKRYLQTLGALVEGGMKDGWNHVVLPLSQMSDLDGNAKLDMANVNYFRQYFFAGIKTGENGLTIAYDNLIFTKNGETVATLSDVEPDANGWERDGKPIMIGDTYAMGTKFTSNINGGAGFNFLYFPGESVAIDVDGMKYFEFDWFVSDAAAVANTTFVFELTSSGTVDKEEIGKIFTGAELGLKDGWNHIKFTIGTDLRDTADNGAFRPENFNTLRLFNDNAITVNGELTLAFANVRFTDDQAPVIETPANPDNIGGGDNPVVPPACTEHVDADKNGKCDNCGADVPVEPDEEETTKEDLYEFQIDNGANEAPYLDPDYTANWNGTLRFADGSQYFQYKYDLTAFRGIQSITFSGNFGGQYHIWASADGKNWVEIAKRSETSPAKSLTLDLTVLAEEIAKTMTVYVRIGDSDTSNGNGGNMNGNVQLKVVYDAKADQTPIVPEVVVEQEKISFKIETEDEKAYLIENTGKWNNVHRYSDANAYYTYKYTVKNVNQVQSVIWKAKTCQEFKLDISFDNKNWTTVSADTSNTAPLMREYDLTEFLVKDGTIENATFYLKICDADTADGWGGGIYGDAPVTLLVDYVPLTAEQMDAIEATVTEHRIPLWGANKTWGDIYVEDTENQIAGSACISANLKGVKDTHAPSKKFESVDATGMDTFEFYVYLSDLAIVDHLKNNTGSGSVEICSGGNCDQGEKAVSLNQIFTDFVVGELSTGWNLIAIPLNKMASTPGAFGEFQLNNINYIRIFWSGMTNPTDQDWVIKFDSFAMTDRQAEIERQKEAFKQQVLEENAGLIANIEALKNITEITAENINSAKSQLSAAKAGLEALSDEAQAILIAEGYKKTINDLQKLIDNYKPEEEKPECTEHVDADNNGKCDNCDADVEVKGGDDTETPDEGCNSSMTIGAIATMVLAGAWVSIAARKKED